VPLLRRSDLIVQYPVEEEIGVSLETERPANYDSSAVRQLRVADVVELNEPLTVVLCWAWMLTYVAPPIHPMFQKYSDHSWAFEWIDWDGYRRIPVL
jgi:hypothetical protein